MDDSKTPRTENIKYFSTSERAYGAPRFITSTDAIRDGLPANCIVTPMQILDPPQPIKKRK